MDGNRLPKGFAELDVIITNLDEVLLSPYMKLDRVNNTISAVWRKLYVEYYDDVDALLKHVNLVNRIITKAAKRSGMGVVYTDIRNFGDPTFVFAADDMERTEITPKENPKPQINVALLSGQF